jgi:hypothetical protein
VDRSYRCSGLSELVVRTDTALQKKKNPFDPFSLFYVDALQEWLKMPTAILYADGQKSGPSA